MTKIKFANNTEIQYLTAEESEGYYNGASRRQLKIQCAADAISLDSLNTLLNSEINTQSITLTAADENGEITAQNIYDGYVLKLSIEVKKTVITPQTDTADAVTQDRIIFTLAKRTYIEQQLKSLGI